RMIRLRNPGSRRAAGGVTLIALMIAVVIVAILAAIAVASYDFAMVKARRGAAEGCLQEGAQYMERYYTTNLTYASAAAPTCSQDVSGYYTVGFAASEPTATTYKLQAVPISGKQNDSLCGTLTVDNKGAKTASGSGGVASCW
ncbi:MAG: type IV pilin protein, partial [Lysobacteraceae bacterium]